MSPGWSYEQEEEGVVRLTLSHSLSPSPAAAAAVLRPAHCLTHQPFFSSHGVPAIQEISLYHITTKMFSSNFELIFTSVA